MSLMCRSMGAKLPNPCVACSLLANVDRMNHVCPLVAVTILGVACQSSHTGEPAEAQLEIEPLAPREQDSILASGQVFYSEASVAVLHSPVSGEIISVDVALGDHVKPGQELAVIGSADDDAWAWGDSAHATAVVLATDHELKRPTNGPRLDVQLSEEAHRKAVEEVERVRRRVTFGAGDGAIRDTLTLVSPIDGEVLARSAEPGVAVTAGCVGAVCVPLFTIGRLDRVSVLADLAWPDRTRVRVGAHATVSVLGHQDAWLDGNVDWVSSVVDPVKHSVRVRCIIDNHGGLLRSEMDVTIRIAVPAPSSDTATATDSR